jgi:hypothetical protein
LLFLSQLTLGPNPTINEGRSYKGKNEDAFIDRHHELQGKANTGEV